MPRLTKHSSFGCSSWCASCFSSVWSQLCRPVLAGSHPGRARHGAGLVQPHGIYVVAEAPPDRRGGSGDRVVFGCTCFRSARSPRKPASCTCEHGAPPPRRRQPRCAAAGRRHQRVRRRLRGAARSVEERIAEARPASRKRNDSFRGAGRVARGVLVFSPKGASSSTTSAPGSCWSPRATQRRISACPDDGRSVGPFDFRRDRQALIASAWTRSPLICAARA